GDLELVVNLRARAVCLAWLDGLDFHDEAGHEVVLDFVAHADVFGWRARVVHAWSSRCGLMRIPVMGGGFLLPRWFLLAALCAATAFFHLSMRSGGGSAGLSGARPVMM